jgi:hypothetical protein
MSDDNAPQPNELIIVQNNLLPNIWVDILRLAIRQDGICSLSFSTSMPSENVEQVRIMTGREHLKAFVGLICEKLDYYPVKESTVEKAH